MNRRHGLFRPRAHGIRNLFTIIFAAVLLICGTLARAGTAQVDHSTYISLMDPQGKFVHGFDAGTPGDRIADTMRNIMAQ